jgi:hypothetical protein
MEELIKETRDVKLKINSLLSKKSTHVCLFPECNRRSILSHSISKSTLKIIQKDSHVIHPKFNRAKFSEQALEGKETNLSFTGVGIDKASTFKGFCKEHDNQIFSSIDNDGIKTQRDIFLQIYRTACEQFFTKKVIEKAEVETLRYEYHSNSEYDDSLSINLEKIIYLCEDLLVDFPELSTPLKIKDNETLSVKPFSNKIKLDVEILYKKINIVIPVALQKCFQLHFNKEHSESLVIIIPDDTYTNIIILCSPKVTPQYTRNINSQIMVLNFIESILMQDSDFYLNPLIVDKWNKNKHSCIENDFYFFNERTFLEEYELSIFDDLRGVLCLELPEKERVHELRKIYETPSRDSIEARNRVQMLNTIKDRHKKLLHTGNKTGASYPIGSIKII